MLHYRICLSIVVGLLLLIGTIRPVAAQDDAPPLESAPPMESVAVVRGQGARLLNESGRQVEANLSAGTLVIMVGRSADGGLIYVLSGLGGAGWVAAGSLLTVDTSKLPVRTIAAAGQGTPLGDSAPNEAESPVVAGASAVPGNEPTATARVDVAPQAAAQAAPQPTTQSAIPATTSATGLTARVVQDIPRLNLRAGPGTAYAVVDKADPGSTWQVIGRTTTGAWVQVRDTTDDNTDNTVRWAATDYLDINTADGSLNEVPVITEIPAVPAVLANTDNAGVAVTATTGMSATSTAAAPAVAPIANKTGLSGMLAFQARNGGTIYTYNLDTDVLTPLTGGIDPAISPDGRTIAFARDGGDGGLYVMNIDGSGERRLFSQNLLLRSPKWRPDGQRIMFSRTTGYDDCRLLGGGTCLPDEAILDGLPPELQGPGVVNAVRNLRNQREYFFGLGSVSIEGGDYRDIPALNKAAAPDWVEAGIVYHSSGGGIQITEDKGGTRSREVANEPLQGYFHDPDWQSGGGRIVFHRKMGGHWQIFAVNPDGNGLTALTRPVTALVDELPSNVSPAWSPDGQQIIYASSRNSIESAGAWHFWVMDADGGNQRRLPIDVPLDYTFSSEQMVSWGQ